MNGARIGAATSISPQQETALLLFLSKLVTTSINY